MRRACIGLLLVIGLLLLVGCAATSSKQSSGAASTTGATGPTSAVCQGLSSINQALAKVAGIGSNTTVSEVKAIQAKLTSALNTLNALPGTRGSAYDAIKSLNDQLTQATAGQPDSATVGQISPRIQNLQSKVAPAQAAASKLTSLFKC